MSNEQLRTVIALVVVVAMLPALFSVLTAGGHDRYPATVDTNQSIHDAAGSGFIDVRASRGNAIKMDGDDSVAVPSQNLTHGSWTLCAAGSLVDDAHAGATYTLAGSDGGEALLLYDAGQWRAYHWDVSENESATATVPAADATALTPACARWNESTTTLTVRADGSSNATAGTAGRIARNSSLNWRGTVDELRAFNESVPDSTLTEYEAEPHRGQSNQSAVVWVYFDAGSGDTEPVYYASVDSVSVVGTTWVNGVSPPGLTAGVDYRLWEEGTPTLRVLSGGFLDGAPVVFVRWGATPYGLAPIAKLLVLLLLVVVLANKITAKL